MDYAERLMACGVSQDDAWFIVNEFSSENDIAGLEDYVTLLEQNGG